MLRRARWQLSLPSQEVDIPCHGQHAEKVNSHQNGQRVGPLVHVRGLRPVAKRFDEIDRVERDD